MIHFYLTNVNRIIASNFTQKEVQEKYKCKSEILTSVKEVESVALIRSRLERQYPNYAFEEYYIKVRKKSTHKKTDMSYWKIGKPKSEETKRKISEKMKGKSNFAGKRHSQETKHIMAQKKIGNDHVKDTKWVHLDTVEINEKRVKSLADVKAPYMIGRDYYSVEPGLYYFLERNKAFKRKKNNYTD